MTVPDRFERAFDAHDAYERDGDGFALTTVAFDARATAEETDDWALRYTVTVRVPTLSAAVEGDVGDAVEEGWFETYALRMEDALGSTRHDVELADLDVREVGDEVVADLSFEHGNADHAPDIAKSVAEYAEGTYVGGVVPGYDYREPVASLLSSAGQGNGERGGTPL